MTSDTNPIPDTTGQARFGRRALRALLTVAAVAALAVELWTCVLQVDESEHVIVERFGQIVAVYDRPEHRGLHFKLPWPLDAVRRFDRRVQYFDPPGREMFTSDKKNIVVATYVCWKIAVPDADQQDRLTDRPVVRFFRTLGGSGEAEKRLNSRVRSIVNTRVGQVELSRLLSAADSTRGPQQPGGSLLEKIAGDVRAELERSTDGEDSLSKSWGIQIVDVRIKRINLPSGNLQAVYDRMRSERRKFADEYRNAGMAENKSIRSRADKQYEMILARARGDAERIRGKADADAIGILNAAHARDPEFYRVMRTLDTYRRILGEKTTLVLSASSNLLKLLTDGIPPLKAARPKPAASQKPDESRPTTGVARKNGSKASP